MRHGLIIAAMTTAICCSSAEDEPPFTRQSLSPANNPFGPSDSLWSPQPHRDHPLSLALSADGNKLYVTLQGIEDDPGSEVAVVDLVQGRAVKRIRVGSSPTGLELHPGGRFLVVTNRFSNFASVIDTTRDEVVRDIRVPFYTYDLAFTADGRHAYLTNRWKDSVLRWDLDVGEDFRVVSDDYSALPPDGPMGIAVGDNPRTIVVDGDRAFVANVTGLSLSILDLTAGRELRRVHLNSPPGDVRMAGTRLLVTHTGKGTQHAPDEGFDGDEDGKPGDGTANVMFQDLQNELMVLDRDGHEVHNFTSDSICCFDFRDVDPDHPEKGTLLPKPDPWPLSRLKFLPPRDTWIMAGALPESVAVFGDRAYVVFSGSNEVQAFRIGDDGALTALQKKGELFATGMNPAEIVVARDGKHAYVAERLGERITVLDLVQGPGHEQRIPVGDETSGAFPATDAELGEAINFVTSKLTVDGDQTCVHCHREGGNIAKPVAMPLQTSFNWGRRMVMAYRGAHDTRPWFFETAMTETNFFPVINEFSRKENFCCEQLDPLIWSKYPSTEQCTAEPSRTGCEHVLHCKTSPPPECATRTYGSPHLTRNEHFVAGARATFGRDRTFGDALNKPNGLPLDFDGVTRSLGLFLLSRPRFFPNPNATLDLPAARRGRAIYESPTVGCNSCHPLPLTTVSKDFNPSGVPLRFAPVISPLRTPEGVDADRITPGFVQTFPTAEQDSSGMHFGVPQLRGIWDRAQRFFHDGRARSLREALATPGHPALRPGEIGYNETDGVFDTHGATSTLTARELEDLIVFLETL
jgi:DNA-binding beta-propeller fold protein YncE